MTAESYLAMRVESASTTLHGALSKTMASLCTGELPPLVTQQRVVDASGARLPTIP